MAFFSLLAFISLYFAAFKYQLGSHVEASWWVKNVYDIKDHLAASISGPKIIIAGGSSSLYGIDNQLIEDITGYKVANIAVHAELSAKFQYFKIEEHMKQGDIVVMPLEFPYYEGKLKDWFYNNIMAWGYDYYLSKLSLSELFEFIMSVPETRIYEGVFQRQRKHRLPLSKEKAIQQFNSQLSTGGQKWRGYGFRSLDKHGSINVAEGPTKKPLSYIRKGYDYLPDNMAISDTFLSFYSELTDLVEARDGKLILTWPVTLRNWRLNLSNPKHQQKLMDFKNRLAEKGINICCNPALFNLDVNFFFNTNYHLNTDGGAIRSQNLAVCIDRVLKYEACDDIGFDEANEILQRQEAEYLSKFNLTQSTGKKTD